MRTLPVALALLLPAIGVSADDAGAIRLFNGKDLTGFYSHFRKLGKNNDSEKVFGVQDGLLVISGQRFGYLATDKEYENYHLVTEFKWGEKTWAPRVDRARDSGILLHAVGKDGGAGDWMESIECQMIEGGTGDFILVKGANKPSLTVEAEKRDGQWYYKPGAETQTLDAGRINWYARDPKWKDKLGYRGPRDVEKPVGEWNTLECICAGDRITIILNGKVVNAGSKASHTKGKILFQSEGAELFFRTIELRPVKK